MSEVKKEWLVWKGRAFNKDNPAFEIISAYDALQAQLAEAKGEHQKEKKMKYAEMNHVDMSDDSIREVFAKCDTLQAQLNEARAENERLNLLIKIADELITNPNAMEDWENAKRTRVM